jgi:RNA polymerase sigma factor (sigma-70 family)
MDAIADGAPMTATAKDRLGTAFAAYGPRLRAYIRRQVSDLGDAEDLLQDVFEELFASYRLTQPIEQVAGWLLRVARNRIIDRYRARARESRLIERHDGDAEPRLIDEWPAPEGDGPEAMAMRDEWFAQLEAAIEALPAAQREVFIAHELEGRSFRELAAASGEGINTLLGRKHAAVKALRALLRDLRDELDD